MPAPPVLTQQLSMFAEMVIVRGSAMAFTMPASESPDASVVEEAEVEQVP